jgi:hypothetical protein
MLFDTITYVTGADHNYDFSGSTLAAPSDGDTIMRMTAVRSFNLPQNLVGSQVDAQVGPTGAGSPIPGLVMDILVNGVSQGVFTFTGTTGSPIAAINDTMNNADIIAGNLTSGDVVVAAGDIIELTLTTVSSADDISVTFKTTAA